MHVFKDMITVPPGGSSFAFGMPVVFPNRNPTGGPPPGEDSSTVLGAKDLSEIDRRVEEIFRRFRGTISTRPLPALTLQAIQQGLSPIFKLLPVLYRIRERKEALFRLTEEQEGLLDFLGARDRALIRGVAGQSR